MRNIKNIAGILAITLIAFVSCTKEYDAPTVKTIPVGNVMTIAEVRSLYVPGETVKITQDISVYGVVTADESTGNLYKEAYMQDETGALYLRFTSTSGLYIGDSIRVNINGAKIYKYNQMLQVDSLHADNSILKINTQQFRTPQVVTINDLMADIEGFQGKLIQLDSVYFTENGQGLTYADGVNKEDISRFLEDFSSNQVEVRTSGYANFANDTLPGGSGTFIGISAQYNSGLQLLIRNPSELNMTGIVPIIKNFEDQNITSGGWLTQNVVGNINWTIANIGSNSTYYAMISNYSGTNTACETWLVSRSFDLSSSTNPILSFQSAWKYTGTALKLMITTNYTGDVTTTTWTDISSSATWSTGNFAWLSSGNINLNAYTQPNVRFAFKYVGTSTNGSTWEIDDIKILK